MGIGVGIVLIVIGLVLVTGIINWPHGVTNVISLNGLHTLGWILLIVGAIAVILVLVMNAQRTRTRNTTIQETRDTTDPRL